MRLSRLLQRCPPGRNVRRLLKGTMEGTMAVGEGVMTSTPKEVEGDMREEGEGKETGEAEGEQEGATIRVEEEGAMEEETTRVTFRILDTMGGAGADTTTTTTKTETGITREVGVGDPVEGEDAVVEAGEEEGVRI